MNTQLPELIVGKIPFLVCLPYFYKNLDPKFSHLDGPPSALNPLLHSGKIHAAPLSSITYARDPQRFLIMPEICTSSHLEVHSVLLCSQVEIHSLHQAPVWLSTQSATSIQLFQLLCQKFLRIEPQLVHDPEHKAQCQAQVLIGDEALRARESGSWPYIYELDKLWRDWKGLPFVFGIWTLYRPFIQNGGHGALQDYFALLKQNLLDFPQESDLALNIWSQNHPLPLDAQKCKDFLQRMDYILDQDRIQSLQIFYDECYQGGFIANPVQLQFWDPKHDLYA